MKHSLVLLLALCFAFATHGCSSSEETERDWRSVPPYDTTTVTKKPTFETHTDTVTTQQPRQQTEQSNETGPADVRYTVQIGSFHEVKNAGAVQAVARQRYQLPVVNDYNSARKLFQVRIGFFETEEAAIAFRSMLMKEYPREYRDAWVVQISK